MTKPTNKQGRFQIPCTEVFPHEEKHNIHQSLIFSAITMTSAVWKSGDKGTITVTFGSYNCDGCSPDASWSQIGRHSNDAVPSMNLGFIDPPYTPFTLDGVTYTAPASATRNYCGNSGQSSCHAGWVPGATVIHEFGHALGMMHEHQNNLYNSNPLYNNKGISLNKPAIIEYYNQLGMGASGAATNVLDNYSDQNTYAGTKFDPQSIMLYFLPDDWIIGKNPTYPNFVLSREDIGWLQQLYPLNETDPPVLTVKFIDRNPEPWKVAWVKKIVTETYGPLISVKWNFITPMLNKQAQIGNKDQIANTAGTTSSTLTLSPQDQLNIGLGVGLGLGIPLIIAVCVLFWYFRPYSAQKARLQRQTPFRNPLGR